MITTNCVIDARSKALDGVKNVVSSAVNFGDLRFCFNKKWTKKFNKSGRSSWDAHLARNVAYWFQCEGEGLSHYCQWQCKWPINHLTFKSALCDSSDQLISRWNYERLKWSVFHHLNAGAHACISCNTTIIYNIQWIIKEAWRITLHSQWLWRQ